MRRTTYLKGVHLGLAPMEFSIPFYNPKKQKYKGWQKELKRFNYKSSLKFRHRH
jgi:hypothetical protein